MLLLFALLAQPPQVRAAGVVAGRATVIDGDTLEIHGERIRLWGVDAPEGRQTCRDAGGRAWRCGQKAAFALADLVGQATVRCEAKDQDRYGRLVARCRTGRGDLGSLQVRGGWALDWRRYSGGAYAADERVARRGKVGVWAGRFETPWDWRRRNAIRAAGA